MDYITNFYDNRIKPLKPREFRHKLFLEHVDVSSMDTVELYNNYNKVEKVALCVDNPIRTTYIQYHRKKVYSVGDPYIRELVNDLMFFNRGIDAVGIKKMTTFLIGRVVKKLDGKPVLTFEDLHPIVSKLVGADTGVYKLLTDVIIFYSRDNMFEPNQRRQYSLEARNTRGGMLAGQLIHNAAVVAVEHTEDMLKVTNPRVLDKVKEKKIKTINTLIRHMQEDTKEFLDKHNQTRPFIHVNTKEKFLKFLKLPSECSIREASDKLGVSKSTVTLFREAKEKLEE